MSPAESVNAIFLSFLETFSMASHNELSFSLKIEPGLPGSYKSREIEIVFALVSVNQDHEKMLIVLNGKNREFFTRVFTGKSSSIKN
jgi:hypothetical protein